MTNHKNGNESSRARLAKIMRLEQGTERFEHMWRGLVRRKLIEDWEEGRGEYKTDDLEDDAKLLLEDIDDTRGRSAAAGRKAGPREVTPTVRDVPVEPTERDLVASEALRKYLVVHASAQPLVRKFREQELPGGRLLTRDEEIEAFLTAKLDVELDLDQYLRSHRGKPSNALPFRLHNEPSNGDGEVITNKVMVGIIADEHSEQERQLNERWPPADATSTQSSGEEGEEEEGKQGRFLEELGEWLARVYPWSHVGDAVVFVVSGRPPRVAEPLSAAMDMGHATYSLTFSPWVSEESVRAAYRTVVSRHRRSSNDKTLRVFRFVCEQADEAGRLPTWPELLDRWNRANPDERYQNRGAIYKAYARALEALIPPYLPLGTER